MLRQWSGRLKSTTIWSTGQENRIMYRNSTLISILSHAACLSPDLWWRMLASLYSLPCSFVLFVLSRSMGCSMLFFYDVVEKVDANCNVLQITHLAFHQGTSQAMPWLAELVESSEGSLDVLPIQCLCEFLLMGSDENKSNDPKVKQTQVRHKCVYLAVCSITLQGLSTRFIWKKI